MAPRKSPLHVATGFPIPLFDIDRQPMRRSIVPTSTAPQWTCQQSWCLELRRRVGADMRYGSAERVLAPSLYLGWLRLRCPLGVFRHQRDRRRPTQRAFVSGEACSRQRNFDKLARLDIANCRRFETEVNYEAWGLWGL